MPGVSPNFIRVMGLKFTYYAMHAPPHPTTENFCLVIAYKTFNTIHKTSLPIQKIVLSTFKALHVRCLSLRIQPPPTQASAHFSLLSLIVTIAKRNLLHGKFDESICPSLVTYPKSPYATPPQEHEPVWSSYEHPHFQINLLFVNLSATLH